MNQALQEPRNASRESAALVERSRLAEIAALYCVPVEVAESVYQFELGSLLAEARIRTFLPIIAQRRVREVLRRRQRDGARASAA